MSLTLKSSRLVRCAIGIALIIESARGLHANNDTWKTAGTSGNWNDNTKWTDGSFPIGTDAATFGVTGTYTVTFVAVPTAIEDLTVSAGTVTMQSSGGPFTLGVTSASGGANAINVTGATTTLTLGTAVGQLSLTAGGSLSVNSGATLNDKFGSDLASAFLSLGTSGGSGTLLVDGSGSTLSVSGASALGQNGNTGTLTFQNSSTGNTMAGINLAVSNATNSSGSLSILSGSTLTSSGNLSIAPNALAGQSGTFRVDGASSSFTQTGATTITLGGTANGVGTINVGVANTGGTFSTGSGLFTINPTGTLNIGSGANTGTLNVTGDLTINGGTLNRGSGSTFNMGGLTMTIQSGGAANFTGGYTTGGASYNVTGAGSTLQALTGSISIANGALITVSNGGLLAGLGSVGTTDDGILEVDGASVTSSGTVTIAAASNSGLVQFVNHATGTFSTINIANSTSSGTSGTLTVGGGSDLSLGSLNIATSGGLTTVGSVLLDSLNTPGDTTAVQSVGSSVTIGHASDGSGGLTVQSGASFSASTGTTTINGTGQLKVNSGGSYTTSGAVNVNSSGGSGTAAAIIVNGAGSTFTQSGAVAFTVGHATTGAAAVQIGTATNGGTLSTGTGAVTVNKTGTITVGSGANHGTFNVNGNFSINGGEVEVDSIFSTFTLASGKTLTISNGGLLNFVNGAGLSTNGATHTITGAGSTLSTSAGLIIRNGSTVNVQSGGILSLGQLVIGLNGTNGTLSVDGATSQVTTVPGADFISDGGTGSLTLAHGAQVTLSETHVGGGFSDNTIGNVSVQLGAHLSMDSLSLEAGNNTAGSSSSFTVIGSGSTATTSGAAGVVIGSFGPAGATNATLTVGASGTFTTQTTTDVEPRGLLDINGGAFNANGNVVVNGGTLQRQSTLGSAFNWAAGHTMTIQAGGHFITPDGFDSPSAAVINIQGTGSTMNLNAGALRVSGASQVNITAGGGVTAADLNIGEAGAGVVVVDGLGSTLTMTAPFESNIGARGGTGTLALHHNALATLSGPSAIAAFTFAGTTGSLIVDSGADLVCTDLNVGNLGAPTTSSLVTLSGAGSTANLSGSLTIGNSSSGPGTVNVNDSGMLTVGPGKSTTLNPSGTFNLNGGIADLQNLVNNGGTLNFNAGSLSLTGNLTVGAGSILGQNLTLDATKSLTLTGTTTIDPLHVLTLSGGSLTTDSLVNNGTLTFSGGTLRITGAAGLTIGAGGPLGASFALGAGRILNVTNTATIQSGATLAIDDGGTINAGAYSNQGIILLRGATGIVSGGTLTNSGILRGDGSVAAGVTNAAAGELRAESGKTLNLLGANGVNAGKINLQGGTVQFSNPLTNGAAGLIAGRGTLFTGGAGLNNLGNISLSSGISDVFGDVVNNTASGAKGVTVSGNADVTFWDDVTNTSGLFKVSPGSSATFFGTFGGGGISGSGQVNFEADVTPGFSPAAVTFGGNLTFDSTSTLHIDIGGTTPGSGPNNHDQVNIVGTATLGGTLDLVPFNGFVPASGDKFVVMTYASATGTFATVTGTTPAPGLTYTPVYSPTNLTILTTNTGEKTWAVDASGNASVGANWTGGIAPGGVGDSATFSTIVTAPRVVTLDADTTVGTLKFDSPVSYTLAGPHTLALQAAGVSAAAINVLNLHGNGAHTISAPITLASNLNILQNSSGTLRLTGSLDDSTSRTITKSGSGTVEIAAQPNLGANTALSVTAGTLRFAATSGSPTLGTGVQVDVNGFGTLELAGAVSALASSVNRVNIANNSSAAVGILVSGTNQVVGNIDGSGITQVNSGSGLTANHIIQGALVIGGTANTSAIVTIAASDAAGNSLASGADGVRLSDAEISSLLAIGSQALNADPMSAGLPGAGGALAGSGSAVPEPSSLLLLIVAIGALAISSRRMVAGIKSSRAIAK